MTPKARDAAKQPKTAKPGRSVIRKPNRPRPEPPDPLAPGGPSFADPWFPDLSIQLYGCNWDFEMRPGDTIEQLAVKTRVRDALQGAVGGALAALLPTAARPDIQFAFDSAYPGTGTGWSLSIGFWLERLTDPSDARAIAARRNGLLRLRSAGMRERRGELTVRFGLIDDLILRTLRGLPSSLPAGAPAITMNSIQVVPSGSSVTVDAFIGTAVPVLQTVNHRVQVRVDLGARSGDLTVTARNLTVSGDFLIGTLDASALLPFLIPSLGRFAPRVVFMDDLKLSLDYSAPAFETRARAQFLSGQLALVVPMAWQIAPRQPSVRINGPVVVRITGTQATARYTAVTTDMFAPSFVWKVGGRVQAETGPVLSFVHRAGTQQPNTNRSTRVEVTATEAAPPHLQRSASRLTTVRVIRVDL